MKIIQKSTQPKKIIVLDTSAFIAGFDPFLSNEEQITAPKVTDELKSNSLAIVRFETAVESGRLKIMAPTEENYLKVKAQTSQLGDSYLLSETDMQLLALALEYKAKGYSSKIVTDDYSMQNVAKRMDIEFSALVTFGIKRVLEWKRYCPACHKEYPINSSFSDCQVCGTPLKRKPKRSLKSSLGN